MPDPPAPVGEFIDGLAPRVSGRTGDDVRLADAPIGAERAAAAAKAMTTFVSRCDMGLVLIRATATKLHSASFVNS